MNLFAQMIDYVRAQQMYANLNCILNNKLNNFTFLTKDYIVSDGFIGKKKNENQKIDDTFKENLYKSFIINNKPNAHDGMKKYYNSIGKMYTETYQTKNKKIINYDEFVESVNQDESGF